MTKYFSIVNHVGNTPEKIFGDGTGVLIDLIIHPEYSIINTINGIMIDLREYHSYYKVPRKLSEFDGWRLREFAKETSIPLSELLEVHSKEKSMRRGPKKISRVEQQAAAAGI